MIRKVTNEADRARQLRHMTSEMLRAMSPQYRDRMMQRHLAAARGSQRNARLCRQMTATILRARSRHRQEKSIMLDDPLIDALRSVTEVLDRAHVPYAITGSVASSVHGEPYVSEDIDLVVRMTPEQAADVASKLPKRFYVNAETWKEEARRFGFVNVIDQNTQLKIDLSMLSSGRFHDEVFRRRSATDLGGTDTTFQIVSPEDIILMKLAWRKDTRSQKQWDNALSVARVGGARLDWKYMFLHATDLGITDDLSQLRDEAGI